MKQRNFNVLLLLLLLSGPAYAAEGLRPANFKGIYEFAFAGMGIGRMGIEVAQDAAHYSMASDITTTGLVRLFVKHVSHTTVEANGKSLDYETHYATRNKKKYVHLIYKDGKLAEATLVPPDNPKTRPPVPAELASKGVNPLFFLVAMRQALWDAMHSGKAGFTLYAFDGRRLTEVDFTLAGKKTIRFGASKIIVNAIDARRKQIAGFTQTELAEYNPHEPTLHIYFSDDTRLLPLKLEATMGFGTVSATLAKECRTGESCLLGIRE